MFDILGVPLAAVSVHGDFPPKIRWNFGGLDNIQLYIDVLVSLPLSLFYAHVIGTYIVVNYWFIKPPMDL